MAARARTKAADDEGAAGQGRRDTPAYRYRWTESGAEWTVTEDGHYRVLRCGDLVAGVRVRLLLQGLRHREGYLRGLLPGWGPPPLPVVCLVELDPPRSRDPKIEPKTVWRHYGVEQLEVIAK